MYKLSWLLSGSSSTVQCTMERTRGESQRLNSRERAEGVTIIATLHFTHLTYNPSSEIHITSTQNLRTNITHWISFISNLPPSTQTPRIRPSPLHVYVGHKSKTMVYKERTSHNKSFMQTLLCYLYKTRPPRTKYPERRPYVYVIYTKRRGEVVSRRSNARADTSHVC